ncbi:hypothetical protein [Paenibacillus macerans]|uniref:hypothetical protein n=1 Tax=Paenibacillus macerans TaxID=44252 RepID=UPI00203B03EB|nr:hypothetical protein [Paenibacillus macerans]MCM3698824.1 hypothetical protein [Paenibacillus macerans]
MLGNLYVVQEVVGQGSHGLTYKCVDRTSGGLVAVKQARLSKGPYAKRLLERERLDSGNFRRYVWLPIPRP